MAGLLLNTFVTPPDVIQQLLEAVNLNQVFWHRSRVHLYQAGLGNPEVLQTMPVSAF